MLRCEKTPAAMTGCACWCICGYGDAGVVASATTCIVYKKTFWSFRTVAEYEDIVHCDGMHFVEGIDSCRAHVSNLALGQVATGGQSLAEYLSYNV